MTKEQKAILGQFSPHELAEYLKRERNQAFIMWGKEDVITAAADMEVEITEDQINEVIFELNDNADASIGISWFEVEGLVEQITKR